MSSFNKNIFAVALLGLLPFLGCQGSDDPRNIQIEGTITLNGKPIENGKISFTPDSQAGNRGPMGICKIKDGKYTTNSIGGRGVVGGHHIVEIENYSGTLASKNAAPDLSGMIEGGISGNSRSIKKLRIPKAHFEDWDIPVGEPLIHRDFNIEKK